MSFSQEVKKEIVAHDMPKNCCAVAAAYGIACFAKYFDTHGVVLHTEQLAVTQYVKKLYEKVGIEGKIYVKGTEANRIYEFAVKEEAQVEKMLSLFGHEKNTVQLRINSKNFCCENCVHAFVSAAFLAGGTMTNPEKDYNLEFLSIRQSLLHDFEALLTGHSFSPKRIVRKGAGVLYFKASEQIEDMLTFMGAFNASLSLMNAKIYKEIRNKANRLANCDSANIEKTVEANQKVLAAVQFLEENKMLSSLPEILRTAAEMCRQHPEYTLKELAACFEPPLSKSGLSHRFTKLVQTANDLKERKNNG